MKKTLEYMTLCTLVLGVGYFAAFFILGWLAPHHKVINRFYSNTFYSLRCVYESDYINRLEKHEGILRIKKAYEGSIVKPGGYGIGFVIPDALKADISSIPEGTEVEAYIGKRLDRDTIGYYHNEIRSIAVKGKPKL